MLTANTNQDLRLIRQPRSRPGRGPDAAHRTERSKNFQDLKSAIRTTANLRFRVQTLHYHWKIAEPYGQSSASFLCAPRQRTPK